MKKNEFLLNTIGNIDEKYVTEAKAVKAKPFWRSVRSLARVGIAAALVGATIVGAVGIFLQKDKFPAKVTPPANSEIVSDPTQDIPGILPTENIWQKGDFTAYSLAYGSAKATALSLPRATAAIQAIPLSLPTDATVKVESIIGGRYVVYTNSEDKVIFFDTKENCEFDLSAKILPESVDTEMFESMAITLAENLYPCIFDEEQNLTYFKDYLDRKINGKESTTYPDADMRFALYLDKAYWGNTFASFCTDIFNNAWERTAHIYRDAPYRTAVAGLDSENGLCVMQIKNLLGQNIKYILYDYRTDTQTILSSDEMFLFGNKLGEDYRIRFSKDGGILCVTDPHGAITCLENYLEALYYEGERVLVFSLADGTHKEFTTYAASEALISQNANVVYFKKWTHGVYEQLICRDKTIWKSRLQLPDKESDTWVFYCFDSDSEITLTGKFISLAANDTIALMEKDGKVQAYLVANGEDVTDKVLSGEITLASGEYFSLSFEDGIVYKTNRFSGKKSEIGKADVYAASDDGAFVFLYTGEDNLVHCYNVASLESCAIKPDDILLSQLAKENGKIQLNYNESENTLVISFYNEKDVAAEEEASDFDFIAWANGEIKSPEQVAFTEYVLSSYSGSKLTSFKFLQWYNNNVINYPAHNVNGAIEATPGPIEIWQGKLQMMFNIQGNEVGIDNISEAGTGNEVWYDFYFRIPEAGESRYEKVTMAPWSVYRWNTAEKMCMLRFDVYDLLTRGLFEEGQCYDLIIVMRSGNKALGYFETEFNYTDSCAAFAESAKNGGLTLADRELNGTDTQIELLDNSTWELPVNRLKGTPINFVLKRNNQPLQLNARFAVSYYSANSEIASVDENGIVTPHSVGWTFVRVTVDDKQLSEQYSVIIPIIVYQA